MGYVADESVAENWSNTDRVKNHWSQGQTHYECRHEECFVVGVARFYFTSEEEYLAHWNFFHGAISLWFICPSTSCDYVTTAQRYKSGGWMI